MKKAQALGLRFFEFEMSDYFFGVLCVVFVPERTE
jgi:hypothetical protein